MADINKQPAGGVPSLSQQYTQLGTNLQNLGKDPDLGSVLQVVSANWFTAQIDLTWQGLKDFQKDFNDLAQTLVTLLETLNQILEAVKTFIAAYANPIQTISAALAQKLQAVISDIRQIGLYLTGDWALFSWPLNELRGGYSAYQQRMMARLTDASDPSRPNVTEQTYVLGVFFYISTDITQVYSLVRGIQQLFSLFSFSFTTASLPACSPPRVRYGFSPNNLVSSFSTAFASAGDPLTIANLEWIIDRPSSVSPVLTLPLPPPQGFIIEVSTLPGLLLMADRVSSSQGGPVQDSKGNGGEPRESKIVLDNDNNPVVVMGGADLFSVPGDDDGSLDNNSISTAYNANGTVKAGKAYYYLAQVGDKGGSVRVPPDLLKSADGKTYYLQKTFKVSQAELFLDPAVGQYRYTVAQKDLPHNATFGLSNGKWTVTDDGPAYKYYVRVSSISDEADTDPTQSNWSLKYDLQTAPTPTGNVVVTLLNNKAPSTQRGKPSSLVTLTFPSQTTREFLVALKTALALLVLTRSDLKVIRTIDPLLPDLKAHKVVPTGNYNQSVLPFDSGEGTGLERFASGTNSLFDQLVGTGTDKTAFFLGTKKTPSAWAVGLANNIENLAEKLYKQMGNLPAIESLIVGQTVQLRTLTLSQINPSVTLTLGQTTILNSLENKDVNGVALKGNNFGAASSIFQANDAAGINVLTYDGLPTNQEDFPYLWYKTKANKLLEVLLDKDFISSGDDPIHPLIEEDLTKNGFVRGSAVQFDVGESTETGWFKLDPQKVSKNLFQSEGWPIIWQAQTNDLPQQPNTQSLSYYGYRTIFTTPIGTQVLQQAELVLNVASAVQQRSRRDGAWLNVRFLDNFLGGSVEKVLTYLNNYVKALNNAFAATVQVIVGYIEFLQARIRELQKFIQIINYYIQRISLLVVPKAALLITIAPGTTGTLGAFLAAGNKPLDGPVSYGAGLAVVIPLLAGTKFIVDLITAFQQAQANPQQAGA